MPVGLVSKKYVKVVNLEAFELWAWKTEHETVRLKRNHSQKSTIIFDAIYARIKKGKVLVFPVLFYYKLSTWKKKRDRLMIWESQPKSHRKT